METIPLLPDLGAVETNFEILFVVLGGIFGAIVREIIDNGGLRLPFLKEGTLNLGFIGSIIIGGVAGAYLGGSIVGAFTAGLTASVLLGAIIKTKE